MRRWRGGPRGFAWGSLVAVSLAVVLGALAPAPASAGKNLTLQTARGAVHGGGPIQLESSNLAFETPIWNLECATDELVAELIDNSATKDLGRLTSGAFRGGEAGGACRTSSALGPATVTLGGLPGPVVFTGKGRAELKGVRKVSLVFSFLGAGGIECDFQISKLKGTFTPGGPLALATEAQRFKAQGSLSAPACPRGATLSADWTVTSEGEAVEAVLG